MSYFPVGHEVAHDHDHGYIAIVAIFLNFLLLFILLYLELLLLLLQIGKLRVGYFVLVKVIFSLVPLTLSYGFQAILVLRRLLIRFIVWLLVIVLRGSLETEVPLVLEYHCWLDCAKGIDVPVLGVVRLVFIIPALLLPHELLLDADVVL